MATASVNFHAAVPFNPEFRRLSGVTPTQSLRYRGPANASLVLE